MLSPGDTPAPFRALGFIGGLEPQGDDERRAGLAGRRAPRLGWAMLLSHPLQCRMAPFQPASKFAADPFRVAGQGTGVGAEAVWTEA